MKTFLLLYTLLAFTSAFAEDRLEAKGIIFESSGAAGPAIDKAVHAFLANDFVLAEKHCWDGLALNSDYAHGWIILGFSIWKQKRYEDAKKQFEQALRIHQKRYKLDQLNPKNLYAQVYLLVYLDRITEAEEILKEGQLIFPSRKEFFITKEQLLDKKKDLDSEVTHK